MVTLHPALILSTNIKLSSTPKAASYALPRSSFCCSSTSDGATDATAPWEISRYYTKKIGRPIDAQGNIIDSLENTAEWFAWDSNAKLRMAADVLSTQLGKSSEALLANIEPFGTLIPGGAASLRTMKPGDLIRLAANIDHVPAKLILLRDCLPSGVDVSQLVAKWPEILLLSEERVTGEYASLLEQFENEVGVEGVCAMLETTPRLLDGTTLQACLRGAGHLMPLRQLASSLARYEDYWMQFQTLENEPRNDYEDTLVDVEYYLNSKVGHHGTGVGSASGGAGDQGR